MKKYKQLNREQRYQIGALLEAGTNKSEIADIIGVHKCTISRELKRNIGSRGQHAGRLYTSFGSQQVKGAPQDPAQGYQANRDVKGLGSWMIEKGTVQSRADCC